LIKRFISQLIKKIYNEEKKGMKKILAMLLLAVIFTGVLVSCKSANPSEDLYMSTPAKTVYEQFSKGIIDHTELLKYIEVQKEIVKDVNEILNNYRTGIYPVEDTGDRTICFGSPFPEGCTIPSNIKWEDLQVKLADSLRYNYDIVIKLENDYTMNIEAYNEFSDSVGRIWLVDANFYTGD
jgi:Leu/Phe-tRNA-protein transferase